MDSRQTSHDLLAHFDRPKAIYCPDFEWDEKAEDVTSEGVAGVERSEPPAARDQCFIPPPPPKSKRNAYWVLQWTAAFAVFTFAASVLIEYACLVSAEHSLNLAVRAGVTEATLPRATYESIQATIARRLKSYPQLTGRLQLTLLQNGQPVSRPFRPADGDQLSVTLSAPASLLMPGWVRRFSPWHADAPIIAHAERQMPGRKLRPPRI